MKNTLILFLALVLFNTMAVAQIHRFSNPISAPLHFNPSFVGSVDDYRVGQAYRNAGFRNTSPRSHYLSYDQVSHRLHGAFGVEFFHDLSPDRMYDTRTSVIYAAKFALGNNWMISPGIRVGYQRWEIKSVYIADLDDPIVPVEVPLIRHGLNFSPSFLLNSANFYVGLTVDQLASAVLQQSQWSKDLGLRPQRFWNIQTGYRFEPGSSGKWSLAATGLAVFGERYRELQGQLMFNRRWFLFGLGAITTNSSWTSVFSGVNYQASLGFKHERFRLLGTFSTYSNQFDLSLMLYLPRKKALSSPESSGM